MNRHIKDLGHYLIIVVILVFLAKKIIDWVAAKFPTYFNTSIKSFLASLLLYTIILIVVDKILHKVFDLR